MQTDCDESMNGIYWIVFRMKEDGIRNNFPLVT